MSVEGVLWMACVYGLPTLGVIIGAVVWFVLRRRERRARGR